MLNAIITSHPLEHRGESQVRLAFPFDGVVKEHIKQLSTVRWSQTHRCFCVPRSSELTGELIAHCKTAGIRVDATSLPEVLTKDEVGKLSDGLGNLKRRTLLSSVHACGLRIGEALTLRPADLRLAERLLYVRAARGRKDRRVPLAGKILELLDQYQTAYPCREYLLEGQKGGACSYTSARQIMKRAVTKTGLSVKATLRHSYATHLLQSGTDLRYIQEILGHTSPKTTMLYTHVAANNLKKIRSPFDEREL
jgi:site-specific recombinase XerD